MAWNLTGWLSRIFAGPAPDPALDLIPYQRITTDFFPVSTDPNARCERLYAEKQGNGRLALKFESCAGGGLVSNAMADATLNRPPFPRNLTLAEAMVFLRNYDDSRRREVRVPLYAAPVSDVRFYAVDGLLRRAASEKPADPAI